MRRPVVVDTSALMAVLFKESDADTYIDALIEHAGHLLIAAPTWTESLMVASGRRGESGVKALRELSAEVDLEVEPLDAVMSEAAFVAWRQYGRSRHPARLNYGDCFSYALARAFDLRLLYKGDDFAQTDIVSALW